MKPPPRRMSSDLESERRRGAQCVAKFVGHGFELALLNDVVASLSKSKAKRQYCEFPESRNVDVGDRRI